VFDRKMKLLLAAAVLVMGLNVLQQRGVRWRMVVGFVQARPWLVPSVLGLLALAGLLVWGLLARRKAQGRAYQEGLNQAVAAGPTLLLLPRSDWKTVDPAKVGLWGRLADALPHDQHISFEIFGGEHESAFALHGSPEGVQAAMTQIKAEWPGVQQRNLAANPAELPEGWSAFWCECAPATWDQPIASLTDDPLRGVLIELAAVTGAARGMLQLVVRRDFGTRKRLGEAAFSARAEQVENAGVKAIRSKAARTFEDRAQQIFLQATVRTVGLADTPERAQGIARGLARAVCAAFGPGNPVQRVAEGEGIDPVRLRHMGRAAAWAGDELATLGHLVGNDMQRIAPRLKAASARSLPAAQEMRLGPQHLIAEFTEAP